MQNLCHSLYLQHMLFSIMYIYIYILYTINLAESRFLGSCLKCVEVAIRILEGCTLMDWAVARRAVHGFSESQHGDRNLKLG